MVSVGIFIAIIVAAQVVLPDINEVPADFPGNMLWKFRMVSLGLEAITWARSVWYSACWRSVYSPRRSQTQREYLSQSDADAGEHDP